MAEPVLEDTVLDNVRPSLEEWSAFRTKFYRKGCRKFSRDNMREMITKSYSNIPGSADLDTSKCIASVNSCSSSADADHP